MKTKILKVTPRQLIELLEGKASALSLPSDTELLDAKVDLLSKEVTLLLQSGSFTDVPDAAPTPELTPAPAPAVPEAKTVSPAPKPATPPAAKASESKPAELRPESSPAVAKPPQPPASRYAAKMENEFSPEQRELLSFTVKGDFVIVKPVVFLKTEWDDINEVVRSIGGRWVKGDIVSYWEIPLA
ncbi:MAG: hypothetical protein NWE93_14905 [Candidatus Bathyarchaeota archaeon]|nr:hypothetical protein [Candidatus Bathyarchaeota archaeon]